jgi:hypothetical protein
MKNSVLHKSSVCHRIVYFYGVYRFMRQRISVAPTSNFLCSIFYGAYTLMRHRNVMVLWRICPNASQNIVWGPTTLDLKLPFCGALSICATDSDIFVAHIDICAIQYRLDIYKRWRHTYLPPLSTLLFSFTQIAFLLPSTPFCPYLPPCKVAPPLHLPHLITFLLHTYLFVQHTTLSSRSRLGIESTR